MVFEFFPEDSKCCSDVTVVQSDVTIVVPWQLSTGS